MVTREVQRAVAVEDLLSAPDDGIERWLIRGALRENSRSDCRLRTPDHAGALAGIAAALKSWRDCLAEPGGRAYARVWVKLRPDTLMDIDVAYVSAGLRATTPKGRKVIDGVPILAVEILSPSDVHEDVTEKLQEYLGVGVALVWVVDPDFETVTVYRRDAEPVSFNKQQDLTGDPHLPSASAWRNCSSNRCQIRCGARSLAVRFSGYTGLLRHTSTFSEGPPMTDSDFAKRIDHLEKWNRRLIVSMIVLGLILSGLLIDWGAAALGRKHLRGRSIQLGSGNQYTHINSGFMYLKTSDAQISVSPDSLTMFHQIDGQGNFQKAVELRSRDDEGRRFPSISIMDAQGNSIRTLIGCSRLTQGMLSKALP